MGSAVWETLISIQQFPRTRYQVNSVNLLFASLRTLETIVCSQGSWIRGMEFFVPVEKRLLFLQKMFALSLRWVSSWEWEACGSEVVRSSNPRYGPATRMGESQPGEGEGHERKTEQKASSITGPRSEGQANAWWNREIRTKKEENGVKERKPAANM